jgi:hypothetical protein
MQTKPTAASPPPTPEPELLEAARRFWQDRDVEPTPITMALFARQRESAARAEAVVEWLCELSEMWEFSRDASEFVAKFKPWLDAKLKEYDAKEMSEEAKR